MVENRSLSEFACVCAAVEDARNAYEAGAVDDPGRVRIGKNCPCWFGGRVVLRSELAVETHQAKPATVVTDVAAGVGGEVMGAAE